jgi:hypothetical protein
MIEPLRTCSASSAIYGQAAKCREGLKTPPLRNLKISAQVPLYFPQNVVYLEIGQKLVVRSARKSGSQPASFQGIRNTPTASRNHAS